MTAPVRVALSGKSGSGKSRAAAIISEHFGIPHLKTGAICRQISHLLFANEDKSSTQRLDDALTKLDPSIFLRATLRGIGALDGFVVDALRFQSDLEIAREHGCRVVRIVSSDEVRYSRLAARGQVFDPLVDGQHRSETELDNALVDAEIVNDSELSDLNAALLQMTFED